MSLDVLRALGNDGTFDVYSQVAKAAARTPRRRLVRQRVQPY